MMNDHLSLLGRLAAGVAHDLSNYLAVVDLSLASIKRRAHDSELEEDVVAAREAAEHAIRLTRCLLEYARGGAPARTSVDMVAVIRRLLQVFRRVIPERVAVGVELDAECPPISGVAPELEQLVLNLMLNACDAMPEGGSLLLAVRPTRSTVCLVVADTGKGMAEGQLVSGCPSSKPGRSGGNGLGLGIVLGVADRHSASVQVSPRPGGGPLVEVIFPRGVAAA